MVYKHDLKTQDIVNDHNKTNIDQSFSIEGKSNLIHSREISNNINNLNQRATSVEV